MIPPRRAWPRISVRGSRRMAAIAEVPGKALLSGFSVFGVPAGGWLITHLFRWHERRAEDCRLGRRVTGELRSNLARAHHQTRCARPRISSTSRRISSTTSQRPVSEASSS